MTFSTSYQAGAAEINGTTVDSWAMQMKADPTVPGAMQQQQASDDDLRPADGPERVRRPGRQDGVIYTMSQDTPLMTKALEAAAQGNGVGADAGIQADRRPTSTTQNTFEMYIGREQPGSAMAGELRWR